MQQEEEPEQELSKAEDDLQQEEKAEQELPVDKVVEGIEIEMEEAYEHVEQLASGETVQPEDEEQEKTGPLTPEGTSTGGENVGNEEEGESEETQKLTLVTYISEYFVPETDSVPKNMAAQQISVRSQSGEATEITKLESVLNVEQNGQDEIFFRIPLILRQEYRFPAEKSSYPVIQEEPLQKDCTGAGTFLMTEENGEKLVIAEGISPMLDVEAAEADMELSVIAQNKKMKAIKADILSITPVLPEDESEDFSSSDLKEQPFDELVKNFYRKKFHVDIGEETFSLLMSIIEEN